MDKYEKLVALDAWGAVEGRYEGKIDKGYEMFEAFRGKRDLRRAAFTNEILPWLFRAKIGSKKWEANFNFLPPFHDHIRYFVDRDTNERVVTIQPHLMTVARGEGTKMMQEDFKCDALSVPKEFVDIHYDCVNARLEKQFKPLPSTSLVKDTINSILEKAQKV